MRLESSWAGRRYESIKRGVAAGSNCLGCQGGKVRQPLLDAPRLVGLAHRVRCFSSALMIVSSLCIQAAIATFFVFPAVSKRVYSAPSTGLCLGPTRAATYSAAPTAL